jgi:ferritin-like metal-binding protein YciE
MTNTTNANPRYDSAADATATTGDDRHVIATYLSDMLALEKHIGAPLDKQAGDENVGSYADAASLTTRIQTLTDAHERALQTQLDALGGHAASGVKSAWSEFLGNAAAAIGGSRKMKVSKHLRDDYTALALASISYTMLHTTALGLGDQTTAALAKQCLDDYAPLVVEIGKAIPAIVLEELRADGENVQVSAADLAERNTSASWSNA